VLEYLATSSMAMASPRIPAPSRPARSGGTVRAGQRPETPRRCPGDRCPRGRWRGLAAAPCPGQAADRLSQSLDSSERSKSPVKGIGRFRHVISSSCHPKSQLLSRAELQAQLRKSHKKANRRQHRWRRRIIITLSVIVLLGVVSVGGATSTSTTASTRSRRSTSSIWWRRRWWGKAVQHVVHRVPIPGPSWEQRHTGQ